MEMVRSRLQVQSAAEPLYHGPMDCVEQIVRKEGVRGLGRGMFSTVLRDVPAYVTQFYVYEGLKKWMTPAGKTVKDLNTAQLLTAGGFGGMAGWAITYPVDIVKTRLQVADQGVYPKHKFIPDGGFVACYKDIIVRQGYRGLFRGILPCLARAFPVNGSAFVAYETASRFFQKNRLVSQD